MSQTVIKTDELAQNLAEFMEKIGCTNIEITVNKEDDAVSKGMNFLDRHERKDLTEYYILQKDEDYIAYKWTRKPWFARTKKIKYAIKFKTEKEAHRYKNKYKGIDGIDEYEIVKQYR